MTTSLSGKRVAQIQIKPKGDVFHNLWIANPHHIPSLSPALVQNCETVEGETGNVGCILHWNYFHDGKDCVAKTLIVNKDKDKKLTTFQVVGGDFLKQYKNFFVYLHVDTKVPGPKHVVTWTVEYEKLNPNVPDVDTFMDLAHQRYRGQPSLDSVSNASAKIVK